MTRVAMGGTFDVLHRGHEVLLERAFELAPSEVFIGVTTDRFAAGSRERPVLPHAERVAALEEFLARRGFAGVAVVGPIDDPVGRAFEPDFDTIVVTPETIRGAERINDGRRARGLPPLAIVVAPLVLAEDGERVSATRIRRGEIDAEGRIAGPWRVAVGSANAAKVAAVRAAVRRLHADAEVRGFAVVSGVDEQPRGEATFDGAAARAAAAFAEWPEAHFAVGIEAGLLDGAAGTFDVQVAAVLDRGDRLTFGHGPGFAHPPAVLDVVAAGGTVGDAIADLAGEAKVGETGAVGFLSWDALTRAEITEHAVLCAWIPRLRPGLHGLDLAEP